MHKAPYHPPMDYDKQAADLLAKFGVAFRVERIGTDCPIFCKDAELQRDMDKLTTFPRTTHIHGAHHRAFFTRENAPEPYKHRQFSVDYWNSYADERDKYYRRHFLNFDSLPPNIPSREWDAARKGKMSRFDVTAYDVLATINKSDIGSFENFCADFGYDTDSRKAERTYQALIAEWSKVVSFFTAEELEQLQEIQ